MINVTSVHAADDSAVAQERTKNGVSTWVTYQLLDKTAQTGTTIL
jgi:hypothetical protein